MSFEQEVLNPVRGFLGRGVRLPAAGTWSFEPAGGAPTLALELDASLLGRNLQTNHAAAPFFLVCFAYWLARARGVEPTLRVEIVGSPPTRSRPLRHFRRAWIALEALEAALGTRLQVIGAPAHRWPEAPVFNAPLEDRGVATGTGGGREHKVEVALTTDPAAAAGFSELHAPITGFRRQLPLGLFAGQVAKRNHWTPGSGAQADLWSTSPDGATFHLFELKVGGNTQVGVLPELLTYAWLLHRARVGLPGGAAVRGGGPGVEAARRARRIVGWIVAPTVHPLVAHGGQSPLEWLNTGLLPELELRFVRYKEGGAAGFGGWPSP